MKTSLSGSFGNGFEDGVEQLAIRPPQLNRFQVLSDGLFQKIPDGLASSASSRNLRSGDLLMGTLGRTIQVALVGTFALAWG